MTPAATDLSPLPDHAFVHARTGRLIPDLLPSLPPRVVAGAPYAYFVHKHEARSFRGSRNRQQKKSKKRYKCSCGFFRLRLDHGHRRGGLIRSKRGRAISSVGRAPRLHRGCREFESLIAHHFLPKKNITEPAAFVAHVIA